MKVAKWGNSLAIRLPREVAERAELRLGQDVDVTVESGALTIRRRQPRYTLDEMLAEVADERLHEETDWGEAVGKEIW